MTLVHPGADFKIEQCISDKNGRLIIFDWVVDDTHIRIANINFTPQKTPISKYHSSKPPEPTCDFSTQASIIIAGDFNCALSEKDKKGGNSALKNARAIIEIEHIANIYDLPDIWRCRNPNAEHFTSRNKSLKIKCRLDFFRISKDLSDDVHSCNIVNGPESAAITLHIRRENLSKPRGPRLWKLNSSFLEDNNYVNKLHIKTFHLLKANNRLKV